MSLCSWAQAEIVPFASKGLPIPNESGQVFETYHAERDIFLQKVLDETTAKFFGTDLGQALCSNVFDNSSETESFTELERRDLIRKHLGVEDEAILRGLSAQCSKEHSRSHPYVYPRRGLGQHKFLLSPGGDGRRLYVLSFSDAPTSFTSWTDPFANRTTIILPTALKNDLAGFKAALMHPIAHENCVYFNSKSSLWADESQSIGPLVAKEHLWKNHPAEGIAVTNPHIASALAALACFRVEKEVVPAMAWSFSSPPPNDYPQAIIDFLDGKCHGRCLVEIVRKLATSSLPMSLPLLASSPTYIKLKLGQLRQGPRYEQEKNLIERVFLAAPENYLKSDFSNFSLFDLALGRPPSHSSKTDDALVTSFFRARLLEEDLKALDSASGYELLEFMTTPLMSGYNISYSSAPRPRFRGW